MLERLKSMLKGAEPAGPPQILKRFDLSDPTINQDRVSVADDGWRIEGEAQESVRLFELESPGVERCMLAYRAHMRTESVSGRAYLEMWCRFPGRGEFFSKGMDQAAKGSNDWAAHQIPFFLKSEQRPDLVKLNVTIEGSGRIWLKDVELSYTPLK